MLVYLRGGGVRYNLVKCWVMENEIFFGFTQGQCRFNYFEIGFKIQHSEILRSDIPSKLLGYEFCHKMKSP